MTDPRQPTVRADVQPVRERLMAMRERIDYDEDERDMRLMALSVSANARVLSDLLDALLDLLSSAPSPSPPTPSAPRVEGEAATAIHKRHRCLRCLEEFECPTPTTCTAQYQVIPPIGHCPKQPDWDWIRARIERERAGAESQLAALKSIINSDGSLATHEEHIDILRDAMQALSQSADLNRQLAAARQHADSSKTADSEDWNRIQDANANLHAACEDYEQRIRELQSALDAASEGWVEGVVEEGNAGRRIITVNYLPIGTRVLIKRADTADTGGGR